MANKVSYQFDPWEITGVDKPKDKQKISDAQDEVADFLLMESMSLLQQSKSPVGGGDFKSTLSKEYKAKKVAQGGSSKADLELDGDLLSALDVKKKSNGKLEYGVFGKEQALKADGHNHSKVFGKSTLPKREFIPKDGQTFQRNIVSGMKSILQEYEEEDNGEG